MIMLMGYKFPGLIDISLNTVRSESGAATNFYGDPHAKSCIYAKFLGILNILEISGNTLIISIMILYITIYILVNPLIRVI